MQPAGSLISLPLFPSKISLFPPHSAAMCQWVFAWNTEIACVLFYLSGIQREFPLQPTAGSGMSFDSPLKSPLTSSPPLPSTRSLFFPPLPHFLSILLLSPHFISFPHRVPFCPSARLFRDGSWEGASMGRRVGRCQSSQTARCKHKELLWR